MPIALGAQQTGQQIEKPDEEPDLELLEFLGALEGDGEDWRDALWILDDLFETDAGEDEERPVND